MRTSRIQLGSKMSKVPCVIIARAPSFNKYKLIQFVRSFGPTENL